MSARQPMRVQTLLLSRDMFTARQAQSWAHYNGYKYGSMDAGPNYWRLRQAAPTGRVLRTITFAPGIKAVVQRNPGLARALWSGAKRGYHSYRAAGYEAKAARHRQLAQNPRVVGAIPGHALEIRYQRTGRSQPGRYKHPFEHPVRMYALNDGSVLLRGSKRLHADDREPDFDQYVHPHHRRRNPMARRRKRAGGGNIGTWLLVGFGAWLLLRPGGLSAAVTPGGGVLPQPNTSFWYSDPAQAGGSAAFFMGALPPGSSPPWRLASQVEIAGLEDGMTTGMYSAAGGGLYVPFTESLAV